MFETERLLMRLTDEGDREIFVKYQQDKEFKTYTGGVQTIEEANNKLDSILEYIRNNNYGFFSVVEKESGLWIGQICITTRATPDFPELGWGFIPSIHGRGFATEAANALVEWWVENLFWHDFYFCISPQNLPSKKLAQKLGAINIGREKVPEELQNTDVEIWYLRK